MIVLFAPLVLGLVPPNRWCGIRLTGLDAPEKWYPLNRRGGLLFLCVGAALVLTGVLLHWVVPPMSDRTQIIVTVLLIPIFYTTLITMLIIAFRMFR